MEGVSLGCFSTHSKLRRLCYRTVNTKIFSQVMLIVIMISSIQLALESPLNDPESKMIKAIYWLDIIATSIFTVEAASKIVAFGFMSNGEHSYMQSPWNVFDFILILTSTIGLVGYSI